MSRAEQEVLSEAALLSFRLNGQFLELAEQLARPVGLTAAWWQVLGAVLPVPLTVAGIARDMGMARQSVQRIADLLVDRELAIYLDNPAHRRAKLLAPTDAGREAVHRIDPSHARSAHALSTALGTQATEVLAALRTLTRALEAVQDGDVTRATQASMAGSGSADAQETMLTRSQ